MKNYNYIAGRLTKIKRKKTPPRGSSDDMFDYSGIIFIVMISSVIMALIK